MTRYEIDVMIRDLLQRDPDGWEDKPNDNDYATFKAYAIGKYGQEGWKLYNHSA